MSELADRCQVRLLLADYAAVDASGKINVLGAGLTVIGWDPGLRVTASFAVVCILTFDHRDVGETPAVELVLEDNAGQAVRLPGPPGQLGQDPTMVVAQTPEIERPTFPGMGVPKRAIPPSVQMVLNFATGLPIEPAQRYTWRVRIDHESKDLWTLPLFVVAPPSGPVFGGAGGPSGLPSFGSPAT